MELSDHLLGKSCSFGLPPFMLIEYFLFVYLIFTRNGFESRVFILLYQFVVNAFCTS